MMRERRSVSLRPLGVRFAGQKKKGGLGILNLKIQNEGLLLKYIHKFYNKMDIPWVNLLWNSYYTNKIRHAMDLVGSFWWRDVCKLMPTFRGFASTRIKDGSMTLFWKDTCLDSINSKLFPKAFSFAIEEDLSVQQQFLIASKLADNFSLPLSPEAYNEAREMRNRTSTLQLVPDHDVWSYP
jgi:hypothetical protein